MDHQYIQGYKCMMEGDWLLDSQNFVHKFQDKDLYIFDLRTLYLKDSRNLKHIQVGNLHRGFQ